MISVIIPVLNQCQLTKDLFKNIRENTVKPDEIILIDNGSIDETSKLKDEFFDLNIYYFHFKSNMGVNKSWNFGIDHSKNKIISILNNDIIINKFFFQNILKTMENKSTGICVPETVQEKSKVFESTENFFLKPLKKREGWAFTIKKEIIYKYGYIPEELDRTHGDDYLFYCAKKQKYEIFKMMGNFIYHYGSTTTVNEIINKGLPYPQLNNEREKWIKIKKQLDEQK